MTIETTTLTQREIAAIVVEAPDEAITSFAEQLPAERVPHVALRAGEIATTLRKLVTALEVRMVEAGLQTYEDPATGKTYEFTANSYRVCTDPRGLFDELTRLGVGLQDLAGAVAARGLRISDLKALAGRDKDRQAAIKEFFDWKPGPKHLKPVDDEGEADGE